MGLKNPLPRLVEGKPLMGKNQMMSTYCEEECRCEGHGVLCSFVRRNSESLASGTELFTVQLSPTSLLSSLATRCSAPHAPYPMHLTLWPDETIGYSSNVSHIFTPLGLCICCFLFEIPTYPPHRKNQFRTSLFSVKLSLRSLLWTKLITTFITLHNTLHVAPYPGVLKAISDNPSSLDKLLENLSRESAGNLEYNKKAHFYLKKSCKLFRNVF